MDDILDLDVLGRIAHTHVNELVRIQFILDCTTTNALELDPVLALHCFDGEAAHFSLALVPRCLLLSPAWLSFRGILPVHHLKSRFCEC